jgi:hypothetical protein
VQKQAGIHDGILQIWGHFGYVNKWPFFIHIMLAVHVQNCTVCTVRTSHPVFLCAHFPPFPPPEEDVLPPHISFLCRESVVVYTMFIGGPSSALVLQQGKKSI